MFKFIHTADLHLDSPMLNLQRYDGAPYEVLREATRKALDRLVELAIEEQVAFVLIAGDLYDGDCRDFNTPQHLRRKLIELEQQGIQVFIVQGNHDAQSHMKRASKLALPDNVHLFSVKQPESVVLEEHSVVVHGQGYVDRAVEENLSAEYPERRAGMLNIGLLHTSCGEYVAHASYAPSTVQGLTAKGYDYWALGHIHTRQVVKEKNPWIVYPGNLQGRHINETGTKGCTLVTVDEGDIVEVTHVPCDVMRWSRVIVDATGCADSEEVLSAAEAAIEETIDEAGDIPLALRIVVQGATGAHRSLSVSLRSWDERLRERAAVRFDSTVWIEKIKIRTRAKIDKETAMQRDDPLGQLLRSLEEPDVVESALDMVRDDIKKLLSRIRTDPRQPESPLDLEDSDQMSALLEEAKELLIPLLLDQGGES